MIRIILCCFIAFCILALNPTRRSLQMCSSCRSDVLDPAITNAFFDYYHPSEPDIIATSDGGAVQYFTNSNDLRVTKISLEGNFQWTVSIKVTNEVKFYQSLKIAEDVQAKTLIVICRYNNIGNPSSNFMFAGKYDLNTGFEINTKLKKCDESTVCVNFDKSDFLLGQDGKFYVFTFNGFDPIQNEFNTNELSFKIVTTFVSDTGFNGNSYAIYYFTLDHIGNFVMSYFKRPDNSMLYLALIKQSIDGHFSVLKYDKIVMINNGPSFIKQNKCSFSDKWIISTPNTRSHYIYSWNNSNIQYIDCPYPSDCSIASFINGNDHIIFYKRQYYLQESNLKVYQISENSVCECLLKTESYYNFDAKTMISSKKSNVNFLLGYGIILTIKRGNINCVLPKINYFNTCMEPVVDNSQCHILCKRYAHTYLNVNCLVSNSSEHCIWNSKAPSNIIMQTFGVPIRNGTGVIPQDAISGLPIPILTSNCHPLCGGICQAENDMLKCTNYCSHIDPLIDDSKQYLGECRCKKDYAFSSINKKCGRNICHGLCKNDECGEDSNMCLYCKTTDNIKSEQIGYYFKCTCENGYRLSAGSCVKLTINNLVLTNRANFNRCLGMEVMAIVSNQVIMQFFSKILLYKKLSFNYNL